MVGINFEKVASFGLEWSFNNCNLGQCCFYQLKIAKTIFTNCNLTEADFEQSDCSKVQFVNCELASTIFKRTNLENANFETAINYLLDPAENEIFGAKFSLEGLSGLLTQFGIKVVS